MCYNIATFEPVLVIIKDKRMVHKMEIKKELKVALGGSNEKITIYILDLIEGKQFNKDFILYLIDLDEENVYASQINKKDGMFELNSITDEEELKFIHDKIQEYKKVAILEGND